MIVYCVVAQFTFATGDDIVPPLSAIFSDEQTAFDYAKAQGFHENAVQVWEVL